MAQGRRSQVGLVGWENRTGRALAVLGLALLGAACSGGGSSNPAVTSSDFSYTGPTTWTITGPEGGPFVNTSMNFLLENSGSDSVSWTATSVPAFVELDLPSGTIAANSQTSVHATLDTALAQALSAGNSTGTLTFHNDNGTQADQNVTCALSVSTAGVTILLAPTTNVVFSGPAGGPFAPASTVYTITNTGTANLSWQSTPGDAWVTASPASGVLAPNTSTDVSVAIADAATASLSPGVYWSYVDFVDSSTNTTLDTRNVELDVTGGAGQSGWTVFTPSVDTRMVYVSYSLGNDANDGLSQNFPKRTIGAGKALLRNGYPDWLLLRKGDTWDDVLGVWTISGRSLSERMLVSSYGPGSTRPLLRTGTSNGLQGGGTASNHLAIVGLHFWANTYNGSNGVPRAVNWVNGTANFLLEDCYLEGYETNLVVQGFPAPLRHSNVTIRRNVIVDAYNTGTSNSEGFFLGDTDGILVEENVIDRNGWNLNVPASTPTWFRRNGYIQNGCTSVTLHGNIIAGTDGVQLRPGGIVENNLFLRNAISLLVGGGVTPEVGGVTGTVHNNVMSDGGDIGTNLPSQGPRGWGLCLENIAHATIDRNVIAHNVHGHSPIAVYFGHANGSGGVTRGVEDTEFMNNMVYDWGGSMEFQGSLAQTVNIRVHDSFVQNNVDAAPLVNHYVNNTGGVHSTSNTVFSSLLSQTQWMRISGAATSLSSWEPMVQDSGSVGQQVSVLDATRTIETYHASIGGAATFDAFMAGARLQSKDNWRVEYTAAAVNDYIRAGFGL